MADEPNLSSNPLQGCLAQVVALLAAGYQCGDAALLALQGGGHTRASKTHSIGPLRCFDSSVPRWARIAMEKSTGTQTNDLGAGPTVPNDTDFASTNSRQKEPSHIQAHAPLLDSEFTVHQISSVSADPTGPLNKEAWELSGEVPMSCMIAGTPLIP